jgi:hypothetical protein
MFSTNPRSSTSSESVYVLFPSAVVLKTFARSPASVSVTCTSGLPSIAASLSKRSTRGGKIERARTLRGFGLAGCRTVRVIIRPTGIAIIMRGE